MKRFNKKGFTLVELLAVIVVLAIVMGLAVVGITSVLDSTRKNAFATDAKSYIEGASALVRADEATVLMGGTSEFTPQCNPTTPQSLPIPINKIKLDSGGKSPYGASYDSSSFVEVTSTYSNGTCTYSYAVYLTDRTYQIGTSASPIPKDSVTGTCVSTDGSACQS